MQNDRKTALITGASRGIGKAIALSMARAGFDVAVTARTVKEGEGTIGTPFIGDQRMVLVPGSIETTVDEVRALGRQALGLRLDIMSRDDIDRGVDKVLNEWGHIDVLVNNALYQGPGLMFPFDRFSDEQLEASLTGILSNQVHISRRVLPKMRERGSGMVVCISSAAAIRRPPAGPDKGGWGFVYAAAKSGFHRLAEFIHVEYCDEGIRAFNVEPGYTVTESTRAMLGEDGEMGGGNLQATTPKVTGDVVAWLCTDPEAEKHSGRLVSSPGFFEREGISYP